MSTFFGFFDFWVKCGKSCFPKGYRNLNTKVPELPTTCQAGRKQCWIWLSLLTKVFRSNSPVVDKSQGP